MCVYVSMCVYVCGYPVLSAYIYVCMSVCGVSVLSAHVCMCMYVSVCLCVYVCVLDKQFLNEPRIPRNISYLESGGDSKPYRDTLIN